VNCPPSTAPPPLVSVVIPTYNYGRFVTQAVDSVLAQTYRPLEVIVVDDGSTDDTRERLQPYGERIRYVHQLNAGPEGARNTGLALAQGEWVAFLDPDDSWLPGKLELQVRLLEQQTDVVMVCSQTCSTQADAVIPPVPTTRRLALAEVFLRNPVCTSTVLTRKSVVDAVGHFRKGIRSEDWDLWMRIARAGTILMVEAPLVVYRIHGGNRSRNVAAELPWAVRVVNDNFDQLPATLAHRILRRQALAFVYLSGSRLFADHQQPQLALRTLWKSWVTWPFGFPAVVRRVCFERTRFGLGMLRRFTKPAVPTSK